MKRKRNSFLLLSISILLLSCVKEVEYNGEDESRLVVNSIFQPGLPMTVSLKKSVFFLEEYNSVTSYLSPGAITTVIDKTTGTVETGSGGSSFTFSAPVEGHQYKLTVTHPDFETVTAETSIPLSIPITNLDTLTIPYEYDPFQRIKATISWQDPSGENYYIIQVRRGIPGASGQSVYGVSSLDGTVENHSSFSPGTANNLSFLALRDITFENQTKSLDLLITKEQGNWEYQIDLFNCDKASYDYILSSSIAIQNQIDLEEDYFEDLFEGGIQSALVEPIIIQSNVENGFGVFGSINKTSITF